MAKATERINREGETQDALLTNRVNKRGWGDGMLWVATCNIGCRTAYVALHQGGPQTSLFWGQVGLDFWQGWVQL